MSSSEVMTLGCATANLTNPLLLGPWIWIVATILASHDDWVMREFDSHSPPAQREFVHGMESVDAADLHDAANRLHEIVEEVVRRGQQNPPLEM